MIKTDKINIIINTNKVKKRYEDLGYIIPEEHNCTIEIDIKDLNKTSHKSVECECDICGKINKTTYLSYNKSINKHGFYKAIYSNISCNNFIQVVACLLINIYLCA